MAAFMTYAFPGKNGIEYLFAFEGKKGQVNNQKGRTSEEEVDTSSTSTSSSSATTSLENIPPVPKLLKQFDFSLDFERLQLFKTRKYELLKNNSPPPGSSISHQQQQPSSSTFGNTELQNTQSPSPTKLSNPNTYFLRFNPVHNK